MLSVGAQHVRICATCSLQLELVIATSAKNVDFYINSYDLINKMFISGLYSISCQTSELWSEPC